MIGTNTADPANAPVVIEGEEFSTTVLIQNTNDRAIRIAEIDTSCECSAVELGSRFLLPGETTTLYLSIPTDNNSGLRSQTFRMYCSDPSVDTPIAQVFFRIQPHVTVDLLQINEPLDRRPSDQSYHDIYRFTSDVRPDELNRLTKNILLSCPPESMPPGGLQITSVEYAGSLWRFQLRQLDERHWLLAARPADPDATVPEQIYTEPVVVHTNHPLKPTIELEFLTSVDQQAGQRGDPFSDLR